MGRPEGTAQRDVVMDIAMLRLLSVTDFATIEQLDIELSAGFSVLTGETGAGKSIIVDALGLLLGGRGRCWHGTFRRSPVQSRGHLPAWRRHRLKKSMLF